MFVLQNIAVCVSDNARVDTWQKDVKIKAAVIKRILLSKVFQRASSY
jgi:hypothetical protein